MLAYVKMLRKNTENFLGSQKIFPRFICLPSDACSVSLTPINLICASNYFDQLQQSVEKVFGKVSQHLAVSPFFTWCMSQRWSGGGACANILKNLPSSPKIFNLRNGKFSREVFGSLAVISFASSSGTEISQQDENVKNFQREKGNYLIFPVPERKCTRQTFLSFPQLQLSVADVMQTRSF